jgi:predicted nucleic acid-binding protein
MKTIIDANYILRWFLNDIPTQASVVDDLLKTSAPESIIIDRVTIAEVTYVLRAQGYDHGQIYKLLEELQYYPSVAPFELSTVVAIKIYKEANLDFEDCMLLALAQVDNYNLGTFDKAMQKACQQAKDTKGKRGY